MLISRFTEEWIRIGKQSNMKDTSSSVEYSRFVGDEKISTECNSMQELRTSYLFHREKFILFMVMMILSLLLRMILSHHYGSMQ